MKKKEMKQQVFDLAKYIENIDETKKALSDVTNINAIDSEGRTLLMWAISISQTQVAIALIENGANIHAKDLYSQTALMWASMGQTETVSALLHKGASLDIVNDHNHTALLMAVAANQTEIVSILLDKGANPNILGSRDVTAIEIASKIKNEAIILNLVANGANISKVYLLYPFNVIIAATYACDWLYDNQTLIIKDESWANLFKPFSADIDNATKLILSQRILGKFTSNFESTHELQKNLNVFATNLTTVNQELNIDLGFLCQDTNKLCNGDGMFLSLFNMCALQNYNTILKSIDKLALNHVEEVISLLDTFHVTYSRVDEIIGDNSLTIISDGL